jgi:SH3-like domain-containing protein
MIDFYSVSKKTGAVALAAFIVWGSLQCAAAQTLSEVPACHVSVYAKDPDPKGMNVRKGPGSGHAALAVITDSDTKFEVTGASGTWLRISQAAGADGTLYFKGEGWVFAALTGVRAIHAGNLSASPTKSKSTTGKMAADEEGTVQSCEGEWVQVQIKKNKGWLAPGNHCGNPVSTCV